MTLDEAVAILNREVHRGFDVWEIRSGIEVAAKAAVFSEFEALAVAGEYSRVGQRLALEDAVVVLNTVSHRGTDSWVCGKLDVGYMAWPASRLSPFIDEFEAGAIAMRYVSHEVERALVA